MITILARDGRHDSKPTRRRRGRGEKEEEEEGEG
jgi:hypothetical protein